MVLIKTGDMQMDIEMGCASCGQIFNRHFGPNPIFVKDRFYHVRCQPRD